MVVRHDISVLLSCDKLPGTKTAPPQHCSRKGRFKGMPGILVDEGVHGRVADRSGSLWHSRLAHALRLKVLPRDVHLLIRYVARYPDDL
jgi:hypothetical protein